MEIKIQIFGRVFSICIGRKTDWFEQVDFLTITEEFYHQKEVYFAAFIFGLLRERTTSGEP